MTEQRGFYLTLIGGVLLLLALGAGGYVAYTRARSFLKDEEGEKLKKYRDIAGYWTIGIGHKILPGENLDTITAAQSAALFEKDIARIDAVVSRAIKVKTTENEKAAILSLAFNSGAEAIAGSTLLKRLNAGDRAAAADQFLVWNKITKDGAKVVSPALVARRQRERALFLS